jgi:environmental stress-induced protein Ves
MAITYLPASGHRRVPWRNGGGFTWEVAVQGAADFDWRMSIAEVNQDGPFSPFPGYNRIITVLSGAGMALTVDGVEHRVEPRRPFRFDGASQTECRLLDGPVRDFNVISSGAASVEIQALSGPLETDRSVLVLQGSITVDDRPLGPLDAVLLKDDSAVLTPSGDTVVALIGVEMS